MEDFKFELEFASEADRLDKIGDFRSKFVFPQHNNENVVYLTGNSLGLQPKSALDALQQELVDWGKYGVEGHFDAKNPWFSYHEMYAKPLAQIVGAKDCEVVAMNQLTVNLHLLMVSFYQPNGTRNKILCEAKAFPSDQYALESQAKLHGFNPDEVIVEISPREGEHIINEDDILLKIEELGDELAVVMIGGVNYYSGQVFNMEKITLAGHKVGANVGFDLAHAAGNIELKLHDWGVDFAAWCSYKYLNSGPGGVSGVFINEKHVQNKNLLRLAGWWGHDKETRFLMEKGFKPIPTAEAWQMSNAPVFNMAIHKASLDIFMDAGMDKLIEKSKKLSGYLEFIINQVAEDTGTSLEIITPRDWSKRGSQISLLAHGYGKNLFDKLTENGVIADWREPNVIRMAPVPLYNSFKDVYKFGLILKNALNE